MQKFSKPVGINNLMIDSRDSCEARPSRKADKENLDNSVKNEHALFAQSFRS